MFPLTRFMSGGGGAGEEQEDSDMKTHRPCPVCGYPMPAAVAPIDGHFRTFYICPQGTPVAVPSPRYPRLFVMGLPPGSPHEAPGRLWGDAELDLLQRRLQRRARRRKLS